MKTMKNTLKKLVVHKLLFFMFFCLSIGLPSASMSAPSRGAYNVIVYIDSYNNIVAEDYNGTIISSIPAGVDDAILINTAATYVKNAGGGILQIMDGNYVCISTLNFHNWPSKAESDAGTCRPCILRMGAGTKITSKATNCLCHPGAA